MKVGERDRGKRISRLYAMEIVETIVYSFAIHHGPVKDKIDPILQLKKTGSEVKQAF